MKYDVVIEYTSGEREILNSNLSYQDAIEAIEVAKLDAFTAAHRGAHVMNCRYWIKSSGKGSED